MTQPPQPSLEQMRWRDYVMVRGSMFDSFWSEHAAEPGRRLLVIVGRGFDPRAPLTLQRIVAATPACPIDLVALEFKDELATDSPAQRRPRTPTNARSPRPSADGAL